MSREDAELFAQTKRDAPGMCMRVTVCSEYRQTYGIPSGVWNEAMAKSGGNEPLAFEDLLSATAATCKSRRVNLEIVGRYALAEGEDEPSVRHLFESAVFWWIKSDRMEAKPYNDAKEIYDEWFA
jgi:hypothetical protein